MGTGKPELSRIISALSHLRNIQDICRIVAEEAAVATDSQSAFATLIQQGDLIEFTGVAGERASELRGMKVRLSDSFLEPIISSRSSAFIVVDNTSGDADNKSILAVPILMDEQCIGALAVSRSVHNNPFNEADKEVLELLSNFITTAKFFLTLAEQNLRIQRKLSLLSEISLSLNETLRPGLVIEKVTRAVSTYLDAVINVILLTDNATNHLTIASQRGLDLSDEQIPFENAKAIYTAMANGKTVRLPEPENEPLPTFLPLGTRCALAAPLMLRDKAIGALLVASAEPDAYDEHDESMLSAVASQAALALDNALLYEDANRTAREATRLYELSKQLNLAPNEEEIYDASCKATRELLEADRFGVMVIDKDHLRLIYGYGMDDAFADYAPKPEEGIPGWVYAFQSPVVASDIESNFKNKTCPLPTNASSIICVPMDLKDACIGVLLALSEGSRLFTVADVELFYTIANLTTAAVGRLRKQSND